MGFPVGFVPWEIHFQLGKRKKFPSNPTLISRAVTPSPAPETRSIAILGNSQCQMYTYIYCKTMVGLVACWQKMIAWSCIQYLFNRRIKKNNLN